MRFPPEKAENEGQTKEKECAGCKGERGGFALEVAADGPVLGVHDRFR
jgi:hypothetical protein